MFQNSKRGPESAESKRQAVEPVGPSYCNPVWNSLALSPFAIQTKLAVSQPGDPFEQEADRVAEQVMHMTRPQFGATKRAPVVSLKAQGETTSREESPAGVQQALSSPGRPLDQNTRAFFEPRFGFDFEHVRIHTDSQSAQSARSLDASAYTVGRDIAFDSGRYSTESGEGRRLIAHELAHVVQTGLGAPRLVYRDTRELRQVGRALRLATRTLRSAVRYLPNQELQALANSMVSVLSGFFPTGHGTIDQNGVITRRSRTVFLDQHVRRGSLTGTYRHELTIYLSEERPSEEARYQGNATGGEIRIFVQNAHTLSEAELIATLAHELVHLFTNIMFRAQAFGHRLQASQAPLPGASGTGGSSVPISIARADPTLGRSSSFETLLLNLHRTYVPVIEFLNQQRAARGAAALDPVSVSAVWAGRTADELLAYVIDEQVNIAVQLATMPGRARVALGVPLNPLLFFRAYAGRHWLDDPEDRRALQSTAAEPILRQAGTSSQMRAVHQAIERWVNPPSPP